MHSQKVLDPGGDPNALDKEVWALHLVADHRTRAICEVTVGEVVDPGHGQERPAAIDLGLTWAMLSFYPTHCSWRRSNGALH